MKPLTAVGVAGVGAGILLMERHTMLARLVAIAVFVIGAAVLLEWVLGIRLGIDELPFVDGPGRALGVAHPGRPAPTTAECLMGLSAALLTLELRPRLGVRLADVLAGGAAAVGGLTVVGYLYEIPVFYGPASATKMALNTGVCFLALSAAVVLARPRPVVAQLTPANDPGRAVLRRLMPVALVLPLLLGWASLRAEELGWVGEREGMWWLSAATVIALAALVAAVARHLTTSARSRGASELALLSEQARGASIAAAAPIGILRIDLDGTWVFANDHLRWLFHMKKPGFDRTEAVAVLHEEERDALILGIASARSALTGYDAEFRIINDKGQERWTSLSMTPDRDHDRTVTGFLVMVSDIHDRRVTEDALAASEELHRLTMANLPGAIVCLYDIDLRCRFIEGAVGGSGYSTALCAGKRVSEFAGQDAANQLEPTMAAALDGRDSTMEFVSDRTDRILHFHVTPFRNASGVIDGVLVVSSDITDRRRAEVAERESAEQLRVAFEQAPIGIVMVGSDGRFTQVNEALCEMTGYSAAELCEQAPFSIVHLDDLGDVQAKFAALGESSDSIAIEHRIVDAHGDARWVDARASLIRDAEGRSHHVIAQILDITDRHGYERQLEHLALHDPLTGLFNRRGFEQRLEEQLATVRRYGNAGALLMVDLDGFKLVNDTLGHAVGDELIIGVGATIHKFLRETDTLARLGGDEFAIILPAESASQSRLVAERLVDLIREHAETLDGQHPGKVTASIGIAEFDAALTAQEMLIRGDLAMYDAKEAGKDRASAYAEGEHTMPRVKAQMTWIERITTAIDHDRFVLYAQPIVDLQRDEVAFHEVLVRMLDDHGDLIPPATFLYIAERFGLAPRLDTWVINHALDAMVAERARGRRLPLSINVSGASAGDPSITELLARRITSEQIDPSDLILELTETAAVADIPRARAFAEQMKGLGVRLALDDFGAGFGSFYYVKHLPFDILKLDGEFVKNATSNVTDREIIKAVATLARGLGKRTIAEFVPDDPTVALLLTNGVHMGQGYHLGKPAPLEDLLATSAPLRSLRSVAIDQTVPSDVQQHGTATLL